MSTAQCNATWPHLPLTFPRYAHRGKTWRYFSSCQGLIILGCMAMQMWVGSWTGQKCPRISHLGVFIIRLTRRVWLWIRSMFRCFTRLLGFRRTSIIMWFRFENKGCRIRYRITRVRIRTEFRFRCEWSTWKSVSERQGLAIISFRISTFCRGIISGRWLETWIMHRGIQFSLWFVY